MADKKINQLAAMGSSDFNTDDLLVVFDSGDGGTKHIAIDVVTGLSGKKGGFSFSGGFKRRGDAIEVDCVDQWIPLDFDFTVQQTVDQPWWPGAAPSNGIDLFGGTALPYGVTRLIDYTQPWDTSGDADVCDADLGTSGTRTGTFRFDELDTGTTCSIRIDMNMTPQIAHTTVEVGLWFQPKSALNGADDGAGFVLPSSPLFFGSGTPGTEQLVRPVTTMYIASDSDRYAYCVPVIKTDNPIIIDPQSTLIQNVR